MSDAGKRENDGLEDLARALRQGPGQEWREEAATDETLTERQRQRHLGLVDVARDAMHRGDRVTAMAGGLSLTHPLIAVGSDYLTMDDGERIIDIPVAAAVLQVDRRPAGGQSGKPGAGTFRARLAELEQDGVRVEVVTGTGLREEGTLMLVGTDHVVVGEPGGPRAYVPLAAVAVVFSRFPPRRDRSLQHRPHYPGPPGERG